MATATSTPATLPLPPGPRGGLLLGSFPELVGDPLKLLMDGMRDYGDVVCYRFFGRRVLQVNTPELVQEVLSTRAAEFRKSSTYDSLALVLGNGLLNSEGAFWKRQRRLAQPAFRPHSLEAFVPLKVAAVDRLLQSWRVGETLDVSEAMTRFALSVVGLALFGADLSAETDVLGQAVREVLLFASERTVSIFKPPIAIPFPSHVRFRRHLRRIDATLARLVAERREAGPEGGPRDLLTTLVHAHDPDTGDAMSDAQLRDELITFLLAGHETTANALAWILFLLAGHPEAEARLSDELERVLGDRPPGPDDMERLEYTTWVAKEAMRLYPPAWVIERSPLQDLALGGFRAPRGAIVMLHAWSIHRRAELWPDPEAFDPERFSPERSKGRSRWAYFPFGGGQRQCIGEHFAMNEIRIALARILRRYRLELEPGFRVGLEPGITLRPAGGLRVTVRARSGHSP